MPVIQVAVAMVAVERSAAVFSSSALVLFVLGAVASDLISEENIGFQPTVVRTSGRYYVALVVHSFRNDSSAINPYHPTLKWLSYRTL